MKDEQENTKKIDVAAGSSAMALAEAKKSALLGGFDWIKFRSQDLIKGSFLCILLGVFLIGTCLKYVLIWPGSNSSNREIYNKCLNGQKIASILGHTLDCDDDKVEYICSTNEKPYARAKMNCPTLPDGEVRQD